VIVQQSEASEVHKLYVNQSMDLQTPVIVAFENDKEYLVSVFAIKDSNELELQYRELVRMEDISSEPDNPTTASAPESESGSQPVEVLILCTFFTIQVLLPQLRVA
jgi:hypothetical protein